MSAAAQRMQPLETETGIVFPADMRFEEWAVWAERLQADHRALSWRLGDMANFGSDRFGERFAAVVTNYSADTIDRAMRVCRAFPHHRRRRIGFSLHAAVLAKDQHTGNYLLTEFEQDELLINAEAADWTREALRQAVREIVGPRRTLKPSTVTSEPRQNGESLAADVKQPTAEILRPAAWHRFGGITPDSNVTDLEPEQILPGPAPALADVESAIAFLQSLMPSFPVPVADAIQVLIDDREALLRQLRTGLTVA